MRERATQPFNSVIITFVFTALYLTSDQFIDPAIAALGKGNKQYDAAIAHLTSGLGLAITVGGIFVALLAPVLGQRADATGRRKAWLGVTTALLIASMLGLFFVQGAPGYFWLGASLIAFGWAVFAFVPEVRRGDERARPVSVWAHIVLWMKGYRVLWRDLMRLWQTERPTLWFLLASAVYRDGLAGVFTFGAIIASKSFGFSNQDVILFGIAANLIAGISTIIAGRYDDRLGPRAVIVAALGLITISGLIVVAFHSVGSAIFWIFGLVLSACVGPAQAASRSLLTRVSPRGQEAQIFGLYATTGRAASFMAPGMWTLMITITGATIWGTLGVIAVVAVGLVLLLLVRTPADRGTI